MNNATTDPSPHAVLEGFFLLEEMLREAIQFVPYCDEHLKVWSPRFTTIILEAASQADSLLRAACVTLDPSGAGGRSDIGDYLECFGRSLAPQWVVFFGSEARSIVSPFAEWRESKFMRADYPVHPLGWWESYNALKHNRLTNLRRGTLGTATEAVAALFLAIVYSKMCDTTLLDADLFESHVQFAGEPSDPKWLKDYPAKACAKIETKLLAHPLGWCDKKISPRSRWIYSHSARFNNWFGSYSQEGSDPWS